MSNSNGQAWGMCAAFGCPLLGTMGSDGGWYCFCHAGKPSTFNDAITRELRENQQAIVDLTLAIRRDSLHAKWSKEASDAVILLKHHPLAAELAFAKSKDGTSRGWLQRLERHLIEATDDIGQQKRIPSTTQTAKIIGPTHVSKHHPYGDGADA